MCWLCRHLQEHLKQFTGDDVSLEAKDQDELEFHYFKLHDYDNNNKLGELTYSLELYICQCIHIINQKLIFNSNSSNRLILCICFHFHKCLSKFNGYSCNCSIH